MSRAVIFASIEDALHFTDAQRAEIIESYPKHEGSAYQGHSDLGIGSHLPHQ